MRYLVVFSLFTFFITKSNAQKRIDSSFSFQTNTAKKYSIYVPTSYKDTVPSKLMLGLHPLNTNRWDAISWCDTLIDFSEENGLLLICPDGGSDGRVDDAIDIDFTSALLDSIKHWYNIDTTNMYAMGFSWGARTTYTYGLNNAEIFGGFMPIGAAINRTQEVTIALQDKSKDKAFYIIHGSLDNPNIRFFPVRDSLISKGAIVKTNYLASVGHTIDFPKRDSILTVGFKWIDSVNNAQLVSIKEISRSDNKLIFFPNPIKEGNPIQFELNSQLKEQSARITIYTIEGKRISAQKQLLSNGINTINRPISNLSKGTYVISIQLLGKNEILNQEIIIH